MSADRVLESSKPKLHGVGFWEAVWQWQPTALLSVGEPGDGWIDVQVVCGARPASKGTGMSASSSNRQKVPLGPWVPCGVEANRQIFPT